MNTLTLMSRLFTADLPINKIMTQKEFDSLPLLLDRQQTASALGCHWRTLDGYIRQKQLTPIRLPDKNGNTAKGSKYRFQKKEVAALVGLDV